MQFRYVIPISLFIVVLLAFFAFIATKFLYIPMGESPYNDLYLLVAILLATAAFLASFSKITEFVEKFAGVNRSSVPTSDDTSARNRRTMLELVASTWVKGVLEKSVYREMLIELRMEERPDTVAHPWDMVVRMPTHPNRSMPPGTKIINVFDELGCALLILGEPGSGKTTMLLELARDTIARAARLPDQPIPVVFNLSSWSDPKQPIADWLVAELVTRYYVPKKVATAWVADDDLLLLLDGLDEVRTEEREACVKALNNFRQAHGMTRLAVCSRIADYEALTTKLVLQGAVLIQPLTQAQIEKYLKAAGTQFAVLRSALQGDAALQELAQSPLMLSIIMLAYHGLSEHTALGNRSDSIQTRRKHIFDTYIRQMFERGGRASNATYSKDQTLRWLAWLARKMRERGESVFLLEHVQSTWLQSSAHRLLYRAIVYAIVALVLGLLAAPYAGPILGMAVGLLIGRLPVRLEAHEPGEFWRWSWRAAVHGAVSSLRDSAHHPLRVNLRRWWREVLVGGVIGVLVGGAAGGVSKRWLIIGLAGGVLGGLVGGVLGGLVGGVLYDMVADAFYFGVQTEQMESHTIPNEGTRQSIKNALTIGTLFGLTIGLPGTLLFVLLLRLTLESITTLIDVHMPTLLSDLQIFGLFLGITFCIAGALCYGALDVIRHYVLRLILCLNGAMPLNYVSFLDYAADRILLRKVGGGYIFVHRLLQEHFAAMDEPQS